MEMRRNERAFTLIELVVAMAILAALVAAILPTVFKQMEKSKVARVEKEYDAAKTGVLSCYGDTGQFPDQWSDAGGNAARNEMLAAPAGAAWSAWDGPYLEAPLQVNPWGGQTRVRLLNVPFDLDKDGTSEMANPNIMLELTGVDDNAALKLEKDFDKDSTVNVTGKVRITGGANNRLVRIFIAD